MEYVVLLKQMTQLPGANVDLSTQLKDDYCFAPNEPHNYALEAAIQLKEAYGGKISIVGFGDNDKELKKAAAMTGVKNLEDVSLYKFTGDESTLEAILRDPLANAEMFSKALSGINYDVVLIGIQQNDTYDMLGPMVAEYLGIPHVGSVEHVVAKEGAIEVKKKIKGGYEMLKVPTPTLLTFTETTPLHIDSSLSGAQGPRYPAIPAIMKSKKKEITVIDVTSDVKYVTPVKLVAPSEGKVDCKKFEEVDDFVKELESKGLSLRGE